MSEIKHILQDHSGTFELYEDTERAGEITYSLSDAGQIMIEHTAVSNSFSGKGLGKKLVEAVADFAEKQNLSIVPVCSFAKSVMEKDTQLQQLIKK